MKKFILIAALCLSFYNYSQAQILCILCYDQNDSLSTGVDNLLTNGGFEDTPCPASTGVIGSLTSFCPNSGGYVCDLTGWTCTGGGNLTYACIYDTYINKSIINEGSNSVYFGNYYCNACSNVQDDMSCLVNVDCGITGIPSGYPLNTNSGFGGTTGVSLQQTVTGLTVGNTYVLEFWAGGEESYLYKGIFALDIGFGDTILTCRSTGPGDSGIVYIVEFNAVSSSHTIKFTNWGHICGSCTELVLDNVRLYTLAELSPAVTICPGVSTGAPFGISDHQVCEKFCVDYYDSSATNPTAWLWEFPGGTPATSTDQNPTNICYNISGTYDVTLITTTANGNDTTTLSDYITVYATPPFPTISQVGYTLTSSTANSYQWQFNSYDIPGATNQSYTVTQTGYYTVVIADSNGCENSVTEYVLIDGIDQVNDASIFVSPNPSSGSFTVQWLGGLIAGDVSIDVVNTLGQNVFSSAESRSIGTSADWKKQIDLTNATHGVYFIEIKTENELVRKKVVIE